MNLTRLPSHLSVYPRRIVQRLGLIAGVLVAVSARADYAFDPTFGGPDAFNGPVEAIAVQSDGKIVLGGQFTAVGTAIRRGVARLNPDGSLDHAFQPLSGAFEAVLAVLVQADGKIYVAGRFSKFDGQQRLLLVRLHPDGSLDEEFQLDTKDWVVKRFWEPLVGAGYLASAADGGVFVSGLVRVGLNRPRGMWLKVLPDGRLDPDFHSYPRGVDPQFSQPLIGVVGTGAVRPLAAHHTTLYDLSGPQAAPVFSGFSNPKNLGSPIQSLIALNGGGHLVVGAIGAANIPDSLGAVRINADGTLDGTFRVACDEGWASLMRTGMEAEDGTLWLGGQFQTINGQPRANLCRVSATGELLPVAAGGEPDGMVRTLAMDRRGGVLVGGDFWEIGGVRRRFLARMAPAIERPLPETNRVAQAPTFRRHPASVTNAVGSELLLSVSVTGEPAPRIQWLRNGTALSGETNRVLRRWPVRVDDEGGYQAVAASSGGTNYSQTASVTIVPREGRSGAISTSFAPVPAESALYGYPTAVKVDAMGRIVLFDHTLGLQRFLPDGVRDPAFQRSRPSPQIAVGGDLELGAAGGIFLGGVSGGWWFTPDGALTADQPASDGAQAEALELLSDGRLAVVFQTPAQELPPAEGLRLFLTSGEMDPSFKADARITGFALDAKQTSANTLLLAGSFGTNRSVAVRLRLDGAVDPQFSTPVTGTASRIALSSTGDALLFSARDHFAEGEQQLGWLVRLKPNGERDSQLQIPVCPSCVGAAFEEGGRILVWGEFTELDGHFSPGLARLLSDGSVDRSFVSGLAPGSGVASVARMPSGDLAAVGWLEVPEVAGVWTALVLEGDLDRRLYGWRPAGNVLRVQTLSKAGLSYRLEMRSGLDGGGDWQLVREWTGADRIEELELPLEGAARYFRVVRD